MYGGVDVQTHLFLTLALVGGEWSASRPGCFTPGERAPLYPLDRRLGGPQSWSGRHEVKILAPTRTRNPTPWSSSPYPIAILTALSRLSLWRDTDGFNEMRRREQKSSWRTPLCQTFVWNHQYRWMVLVLLHLYAQFPSSFHNFMIAWNSTWYGPGDWCISLSIWILRFKELKCIFNSVECHCQ
jgi:hypothetical protein